MRSPARAVLELDLDRRCAGVTEAFTHGLAADAVDLVAHHRVQGARLAFDDHAELDLIPHAPAPRACR